MENAFEGEDEGTAISNLRRKWEKLWRLSGHWKRRFEKEYEFASSSSFVRLCAETSLYSLSVAEEVWKISKLIMMFVTDCE